ncbi:MAG: hypothetical protein LQ338_006089, partial [Usnochroma carphineum]
NNDAKHTRYIAVLYIFPSNAATSIMKQRFSSLDVKVIANELSKVLCTLRLANIYDLSSRILLFKFAKPEHREQIIVDPGFRCHLTNFSRATAAAPSHFVAKLRKYLRTRRITSVSQIGTDRVIELQFSDGQFRLFLEFYAAGNIVLTDRELNILTLLRNVPAGEGQEELRAGLRYAPENRQNYGGIPDLTGARVRFALQKALDKAGGDYAASTKKRKSADALRKALAGSMSEFPPMLIEHALRATGFDISKPISNVLDDEGLINDIVVALQEAQKIDKSITATESSKGYIFAKAKPDRDLPLDDGQANGSPQEAEQTTDNVTYEDFQPFKPVQMEALEWKVIEFDSFNKAVDEFFSSIEGQKLESRLTEKEQNAKRKLENARQDHERRVGGLQQVQELNVRKAQAIEANVQRVQEAIGAVNGLIGQGMDWVEIARLVEIEQGRRNVVAEMIQLPLKLYENTITLLLAEEDFADDEDFDDGVTDDSASEIEEENEEGNGATSTKAQAPIAADKRLAVDIDLALSPWSNARQYYDQKKTAAVKEQKTVQSSAKALKSTEKKINADLKKGLSQEKQVLRPVRKQLWFEKFHFFISSEGYLVIGGKDAQQNEMLYKRYLKKGDAYVHADLHGAALTVVKNKPGRLNDPIPPSTLSQAGSFAVATSSAWDSKAVMSAWWVHPEQVSKTAPTGEYLTTGSFTIKGEKNYLPPAHLLLGLGVLFRVSDESMAKHLKHRLRDEGFEKALTEERSESADGDVARDGSTQENDIGQDDPQDTAYQTEASNGEGSESDLVSGDDNRSITSHAFGSSNQNPLLATASTHEGHANEGNRSQSDTGDDKPTANGETPDEETSHGQAMDSRSEAISSSATNERDAPGVRHLSARERRLVRKGQPPMAAEDDVFDPSRDSGAPLVASPAKSSADEKARSVPQSLQVRGKHGKRNKLKTKYAEQDEEDRALALRLLGSAATHKTTEDAAAKAAKEEEVAAQKQRRRQQHIAAAEKGKEEEELRRMNLEEGLETLDSTEAEALEDLEAYVGTPFAGDEILDILVVCGPWDAIGTRCRWRAKLQPGSTKKGKAVREVLAMWTRTIEAREKKKRPGAGEGNDVMMEEEKTRTREGELLRGLREAEVIGVVPTGKVRVVMGAEGSGAKGKGAAATGKSKRGGRGSKKQR